MAWKICLRREPGLVWVRAHRVEDLGGNDHTCTLDPAGAQRISEHLLAGSLRVDIGRIEEIHAAVERGMQRRQ